METTEQTKAQRIEALEEELRTLAGARAIVYWTAEDVIADVPRMSMAEADAWLEQHEDAITEGMISKGWDYFANYLPQQNGEV